MSAEHPTEGVDPGPDDPGRYSLLGHRGTPLWHPHDPGALDRLIDAAGLGPQSHALDVGCGRAEVALRIVERSGASARAVDLSPGAIALARAAAATRDPAGRLDAVCAAFDPEAEAPADLVVCIGSTHVVGGLDGALDVLGRLLRPGGRLLIGDGFWASEPDPQWITRRFGGQRDALPSAAGIMQTFITRGWRVVSGHTVSPDGWRAYETRHNTNLRAEGVPPALTARSNGWFEDWERWGAALGFGLWLIERAEA